MVSDVVFGMRGGPPIAHRGIGRIELRLISP